jgi:type IV secretory pathway VirB10-like protein
MPRIAMTSAAFAVLLTSVAAAQTTPTPTPDEAPPAAVEPVEPDVAAPPELPSGTAPEGSAVDPADAMDRSDNDPPYADRQHREMHRRHMRMMRGMADRGRDRDRRRSAEGASFEFSRGKGGPSVRIECADRDTTQECVDAIVPLLELVLPDRR